MFYNYNSITYLSKAHNDELLLEASKARQAEQTRLGRETNAKAKPKKAFPFSFGPAATSNR